MSTEPTPLEPVPDVPGPDHRADRQQVIPPAVRSWLYGVATAGAPLLAVYGIVSDEVLPLWLALAAAVLGTGTAAAYRPTRGGIGANE